MKASAIWAAASLFAALAGGTGSCLAAEGAAPTPSAAVLRLLAGTVVPSAELGRERARGISVNVNGSALNNGNSTGNAVLASPITGLIDNEHSINNNVGITSVLQNFGNNSVMQTSTTINISVH
ncbi:MAG TPA: hypothetical protein VGM07_08480 [Stellaceae bacterium]|jgi:hypothetical protein